ncbi:efflux RND transporter periplasmic adaptor subunit [Tautonia plasticadhaerens]|uniref:Cobalt-zinc-cadmium resistance protein CzcB n=1 Tax=Tautonia plasticadhaerens TaxID=2527974 RepID=A0A518GW91_9BACT|nr:efflux RND transporter periplasmic adaptor subunit [Tautonia plasticadhaerens]QDV32865.1 Cobalt-zinc-cadmium resistance protein CzcB [Tautonia plasticadhaerens]
MLRKLLVPAFLLAIVVTVMTLEGWTAPLIAVVRNRLVGHQVPLGPGALSPATGDSADAVPADGRVRIDGHEALALGLATAVVEPLEEPIPLELTGTTAYDPDSMTRIRPRFDTLVREVFVRLGQEVEQGEPLVELYSAALAEAKTNAQTARVEWDYRRGIRDKRAPLAESGAISQQLWAETQDQELSARLADMIARDKLLIYGVTEEQIDRPDREGGADKARMTMTCPTDGVVIARNVVPGNLYGPEDELLAIAPLDHLWVWADVYERDLPVIRIGLDWEVRFPFLDEAVKGRVEYIADEVDPSSRAVRIRGVLPNPDRRFKADMLVRTVIAIPPGAGRVAIPREAMISIDGGDFAFVRVGTAPETFERHPIRVERETADRVILEGGLEAGAVVATRGVLLLEERFEDLRLSAGQPAAR